MAADKTLLLVDDEDENLLVLSSLLDSDYRVLTASTVPLALALLEREDVDLLITDQRMPGTSGVELLRQARQRYPHVVRLALTAYTDVDLILDAINEGAVYRYVIKPWSVDEMRTTIRQALEWGALQREQGVLAAELGRINRELHRRNQELERRNQELSEARERLITREKLAAVGRFAAGMAHEMNQHLQVLELLTSDLLELVDDAQARHELHQCQGHTDQLAALIRDVQEFAHGEKPRLWLQPVEPVELVNRVIAFCRHVPGADQVELSVHAEEVGLFQLDHGKMIHLVTNLVRNALGVTPPGSAVEVRLLRRAGDLVLEVEDQGPGVPRELRQWIFEPFNTTVDSTGLGLTICRWVATLHGGSIEVKDGARGGALFVVTLPSRPLVH